MKWPKKADVSQPDQLSDTAPGEIVATTVSDQPREKSVQRTLFSICNNAFSKNDFEAFLASLVSKSLLLLNDVAYLRANRQVWHDLSNLYKNTKKFQDWAEGEKGADAKEVDDYIPTELLEVMFEPMASTDVLRTFARGSVENRVLLHVVTAPLRKICVNVVAGLRGSGRGRFDGDGGFIVTPFAEEGKRGQSGVPDTSSILKEARRAGLSWLGKQDRESVTALVKDGISLLEKVRK